MSIEKLIRFETVDGSVHYGALSAGTEAHNATEARVVEADSIFASAHVTDEVLPIRKLLAPLAFEDIRSVRCVALNYQCHIKEAKMGSSDCPMFFYKPSTAVTGPVDEIVVPQCAQIPGNDYEAELVIVIGKQGKDIKREDALEHVYGYAAGNDVSQRTWQKRGSQFSTGKMFDTWAPFGPCIVTKQVLGDASGLALNSFVNGEARQQGNTGELVAGVAELVSFLSMGTTLMPGDIIYTGTPSGVGLGFSPPKWLQHGDEVVVEIEKIGQLRNKVVYQE